ncbi:MAG TPA: type III pantothenate kinase, partial [Acidimicrobiales bacterium]|nr:type III pantothenate kinase [Acidimicrobiales bacterium]
MLIAIDVGNTQTVIGLYDETELLYHWRIATNAERTSDEHAVLVSEFVQLRGVDLTGQSVGVAISSGVPRVTAALREMTESWFHVTPVILEPGTRTGMPILYDNPKEV